MNREETIKFDSKPMKVMMGLAFVTFFLGFMAVVAGDLAEAGEKVIGRGPEPEKLHAYPYPIAVIQVTIYAVLFLTPGFLVGLACYPRLPRAERFVVSVLFGVLLYVTYVNAFAITGNMTFFARSQIIWDLVYFILASTAGFIAWRIRISKIKTSV